MESLFWNVFSTFRRSSADDRATWSVRVVVTWPSVGRRLWQRVRARLECRRCGPGRAIQARADQTSTPTRCRDPLPSGRSDTGSFDRAENRAASRRGTHLLAKQSSVMMTSAKEWLSTCYQPLGPRMRTVS